MSLLDRVQSLKAKHAALEAALDEAARGRGLDETSVAEIKRKKLKIKDELERLAAH
jgi:hypothetical protein